jgi:hypothetical protein
METTVEELRDWQKNVKTKLARRYLPDSAELLNKLREEQSCEIAGLHLHKSGSEILSEDHAYEI